jgi:hypothetical protein
VIIARYLTECATCDGSIAPGEEIVRHPDGGWVHGRIADCDPNLTRPATYCQRCNCVVPCWCDEPLLEDAADQALQRAKEQVRAQETREAARWGLDPSVDPFKGFL